MTYSYSEARQNFSEVLNKASKEGKVLIKRRDGSSYILQPVRQEGSPLDVKGIKTDMDAKDIVNLLKEVRQR